jgi:acylphosphatase
MSKSRAIIFYSGSVQGVGFRYTVKSVVRGFEVVGTIRNLMDGRVELVAEGEREELNAFFQAIRESEVGRFVKKEEIKWEAATGEFRGFEIAR